jgi:predicted pyridoxine 5'-phosphate oxidase superfamily flavin-nucleotide-binding protein
MMSKLYSDQHRALQDRFDSRRMADLMEGGILHAEFAPEEKAFIESRDMFFLSTVDAAGRPTVSYKGGAPGFVRVTDPTSLLFPCYDGNGMYYSMGNIMLAHQVGLLFIDFETPHRLRVQGKAEISFESQFLQDYPEAQFMVSVSIEAIWINCPRYIHKHQKIETSKYVPTAGCETPAPAWKRIDIVQDALPAKDQGKAKDLGGELSFEAYAELLAKGEA